MRYETPKVEILRIDYRMDMLQTSNQDFKEKDDNIFQDLDIFNQDSIFGPNSVFGL